MNAETPEGELIIAESLLRFEESLQTLLTKLFDEEKEFSQTEDLKICKICAFKEICRR